MDKYRPRKIINPDGTEYIEKPFVINEANKSDILILEEIIIHLKKQDSNFRNIDDLLMQARDVAFRNTKINEKLALTKKIDIHRKNLFEINKKCTSDNKIVSEFSEIIIDITFYMKKFVNDL